MAGLIEPGHYTRDEATDSSLLSCYQSAPRQGMGQRAPHSRGH